MRTQQQQLVIGVAWLAAGGALLACVGEHLMMYSPHEGYGLAAGHQHLGYASVAQSHLGYFLGVLSVPIYILGYWHVAQALLPAGLGVSRAVHLIGGYSFAVANVWLGSRAWLAAMVRARATASGPTAEVLDELLRELDGLSEPLVWILRTTILAVSGIYLVAVARGWSDYPRWMALVNPITLLGLVFASYFLVPSVGHVLAPAAMNVSHLIFFTCSALTLRRAYRRSEPIRPN